jgi:hypothetical protein
MARGFLWVFCYFLYFALDNGIKVINLCINPTVHEMTGLPCVVFAPAGF